MRTTIPIVTSLLTALLVLGAPAAAQRDPGGAAPARIAAGPAGEPVPTTVPIGAYRDRHGRGGGGGIRVHPAPRRVWIPGHYEWVGEEVWVPGWTEVIWVEPVYEWRVFLGCRFRLLVRAGHWSEIHHPGHFETRRVQVWRPGIWSEGIGPRYGPRG
ncbi:MAG: hypothetical protein AB1726_15460 [Planctomycetota bacterium]